MKSYTIQLRDTYEIPEILDEIDEEEWEVILDYVGEIRSRHESLGSNIDMEALKVEVGKRYAEEIAELTKKAETQENEYKALQKRFSAVTQGLDEKTGEMLRLQRQKLAEQFQKDIEQERKELTDKASLKVKDLTETIKEMQEGFAEKLRIERESNADIIRDLKKIVENTRAEKSAMFSEVSSQLSSSIEQERKRIEESYRDKLSEKDIIINNIQNTLTEKFSKDLETYKNQVAELKSNQKKNELIYNKLVDNYKLQLEVANKTIEDQRSNENLLNQVNDTLKPILKFYTGKSEEKGSSGEDLICNFLRSKYDEAIVSDVSGETASGDLYFKYKHLRCLIEIKNKMNICKSDVDKFIRDMKVSRSSKSVNCGIFVSLQTSQFPDRNSESLQLDFVDELPIVYIYVEQPNQIQYAILFLEKLISTGTTDSEQTSLLVNYFKDYHNHVKSINSYFEKAVIAKRRELKQLEKQQEIQSKLLEDMDVDYAKISKLFNIPITINGEIFPSLSESDSDSDENSDANSNSEETEVKFPALDLSNLDECKKTVKDCFIHLSSLSNKDCTLGELCAALNTKTTVINKLGGYTKLINEAKKEYVSAIITPDIAKKIRDFKSKNGKYPLRATIITFGISHRGFTKLNKIIRTKKLTEYVCKFAETVPEPVAESVIETTSETVAESSSESSSESDSEN